jgi:poly-gamma-glutamate capsule biosynthesis protein CapA/YwtB (metallophosphatase superfamily)
MKLLKNNGHLIMNDSTSINIRAVGDILMIAGAATALDKNGNDYPFGKVKEFITPGDLAFANLEMPISSDPRRHSAFPDVCPDFFSPPQMAEVLKNTGFHVINLANNHAMDWGVSGLHESLNRLHSVGLLTIGAGDNLHEARQPAIIECKGKKVAFLGYSETGLWIATANTPGVAPLDRKLILEDIRSLRPNVDLLILSLHTGMLSDYPTPEDRRLARLAVDNGVDLVLGHGPHVLQGIENYHDHTIVYSMGNFMIDLSSGNVENKLMLREHLDTMIISASLAPGESTIVDYFPMVISDNFQVLSADAEAGARINSRVDRISRDLAHMTGLVLWEHTGERNLEHKFSVMAFQVKNVGWRYVLARVTKIRWRHIRVFLGYLIHKIKSLGKRSSKIDRQENQ